MTGVQTCALRSRPSEDEQIVRRRRECAGCGKRFTTYERVEELLPSVVKKDARREPFDRHKLLGGLTKATQKRPVSVAQLEEIVDDIEARLSEKPDREIASTEVGELVMRRLHDLDEVAYVRFASVYRQFKDVHQFVEEVKSLLGPGKRSKD